MSYFVTGGTGFIGRNLIDQLLRRKGHVYVLVRRGSKARFNALVAERWPESKKRLTAVTGDLTRPALGDSTADAEKVPQKSANFFPWPRLIAMAAATQGIGPAITRGPRTPYALTKKTRQAA